MKKIVASILSLVAITAIAAPLPVVVITAPNSVNLSDAQKSALVALIKKCEDTGNLPAGMPVVTSNTVTHALWKDYIFTELQTGYDWTEAWRLHVETNCQAMNTNITGPTGNFQV